ncbi:MAG: plastocyanin/azurin family copper-binding protein [Actinomycetota bacterium]
MRKLALLVALGLLASLALAACGGGDGDDETTAQTNTTPTTTQTGGGGGGGGGAETISVSADPSGAFAYEQTSLTAAAGNDTIDFDNPAPLPHDVCVEDSSGNELGCSDVVTEDKTSLTLNLEAGTYTYYCDVDGHRAGGMEGTLTVE